MQTDSENRASERTSLEIPIIVNIRDEKRIFLGVLFNYNEQGLYFESNLSLAPGTVFRIGVDIPGLSVPNLSNAEVQWCAEFEEPAGFFLYGVGARFASPLDYQRFFLRGLRLLQT
jgi:hypothetical protein